MEKNLESTILESLRRQCDGRGKTGQVAKQIGLSRPYLNKLVNGKCPVSGLTIETVQRMFPHATFNLNGDAVSIHADQNSGSVVGVNRGHVSTAAQSAEDAPDLEHVKARIISALIRLEIPPDALQAVLRTVNDLDLTKQ